MRETQATHLALAVMVLRPRNARMSVHDKRSAMRSRMRARRKVPTLPESLPMLEQIINGPELSPVWRWLLRGLVHEK